MHLLRYALLAATLTCCTTVAYAQAARPAALEGRAAPLSQVEHV